MEGSGWTALMRSASTSALRMASGKSLWIPSAVSSSGNGKCSWRESEHNHSPPSQAMRLICQVGSSNRTNSWARSVQERASIKRSMSVACLDCCADDSRGQASATCCRRLTELPEPVAAVRQAEQNRACALATPISPKVFNVSAQYGEATCKKSRSIGRAEYLNLIKRRCGTVSRGVREGLPSW